jgi:hypothetical protein
MSDKAFEVSLSAVTTIVLIWIAAAIALAVAGIAWIQIQTGWLILLTIFIGLVVLLAGGGTLLYLWGRNYMARG